MSHRHHHHYSSSFFIESQLDEKVLDVHDQNTKPGAKVVVHKKKSPPASNQLWWIDDDGRIRTALNDFALHYNGNDKHVTVEPASESGHNAEQQWTIDNDKIVHMPSGEVLDIKGASKHDNVDVIAYQDKGQPNQRWNTNREID